MKVLFVHSAIAGIGFNSFDIDLEKETGRWSYSSGIACLAGAIKAAGHEPALLDLRRLRDFKEADERIAASGADVVALSFQSPDRDNAFELARIARRTVKWIIVGGLHASMQTDDCLHSALFDTVFTGPGETALVKWLDTVERGDTPPSRIAGTNPADLDTLPRPHLFPEFEEVVRTLKQGRIQISRGCYAKCAYCYPAPEKAFGKGIFMRDMAKVGDEVRDYVTRYGIRILVVLDDLFLSNKKKTAEFVEMMAEFPKVKFFISTRAELLNEKNIRILRPQAFQIAVGIESGSQRILDFINKETTVEINMEAARLLDENGIPMLAYMINALPGQTREDYEANLRFLEAVNPAQISWGCFEPLPGTALHDYCLHNGLLPESFPSEYYIGQNVLEQRLIKGVDYALFSEYAAKAGALMAHEHLGRDCLAIHSRKANRPFIDTLYTLGETDELLILRASPLRFCAALIKYLCNSVQPEQITLLTADPGDVLRFPGVKARLLPAGRLSPKLLSERKTVFDELTGKTFSSAIVVRGAMPRESYAGAEELFSHIKAKYAFQFESDMTITHWDNPRTALLN